MPSEIPSSLRRSLLAPLAAKGRAEEIERRLIEAIDLGELRDGEQLPPENELAAQLGVAPMTLREALAGVREVGLVDTRRGRRGGTFVRAPSDAEDQASRRLAAKGVDELRDLGVMRVAVARSAARLAANRASSSDRRRLHQHVADFAAAESLSMRRLADSRFHVELALASGSLRLAKAETDLQVEVRAFASTLMSQSNVTCAIEEHLDIIRAVDASDAVAAEHAVGAHLERETAALIERRLGLYHRHVTHTADGHAAAVEALKSINDALAPIFALLGTLAGELESDHQPDQMRQIPERIRQSLANPPVRLLGMGVALSRSPVGVVGPRWAWWRREEDGEATPLAVELDPLHPDFYEYEAAEWFTAPIEAGAPKITGPFVDLGGADDHIFTLAAPILRSPTGVRGVVGADVRVGDVVDLAVPLLAMLPDDAALLNAAGIVVASNTSRWLPTTRHAASPGDRRHQGGALGWSIVLAGS
jgi:DNA-binding FadR family transcriptional regulator